MFWKDFIAIWTPAYGPITKNDWIGRFEPFLKNPIFWRFLRSYTRPNNGAIWFSVPKSCSAQFFSPVYEFWAQLLVTLWDFQAPQKCHFRLLRYLFRKIFIDVLLRKILVIFWNKFVVSNFFVSSSLFIESNCYVILIFKSNCSPFSL